MNVCVFTGPTLAAEAARAELDDAVYLPPVAHGDVYRVARRRPAMIGIVDGFFERVPAVWHKEILWALSEGIHVFGSASMGALRAAELEAFGMEGVGAIFEAYRDGELEDDDEVAVAHGPAETGYRAGSEAMVNIRATLAAAVRAEVLTEATRSALEEIAKARFYPERNYADLLRQAAACGLATSELEAFRAWLPAGAVDRKRADAVAMLRRMRRRLETEPAPKRVDFTFEPTVFWEDVTLGAGVLDGDDEGSGGATTLERLLDELRLIGEPYRRERDGALLRALALEAAQRRGLVASDADAAEAADRFRHTLGVQEAGAFERWLADNHLDHPRFDELMREQVVIDAVRLALERTTLRGLADQLRLADRYRELAARAGAKARELEARGLPEPALDDAGSTREELLAWHFGRVGLPAAADFAGYARSLGYADGSALVRALARDFVYRQAGGESPLPSDRLADLARKLVDDLGRRAQEGAPEAPSGRRG
ncbi:MAG: hypothetical protein GEU88_11765 [Solirubrobacterales bacterium]|nr:hypothetical protein [Solirubrobacterales bacterium]